MDCGRSLRVITVWLACVSVYLGATTAEKVLISDVTCKTDEKGQSFRGRVSVTESGAACQRWSSQSPNTHTVGTRDSEFPGEETVESAVNYCRNPDGSTHGPWCYVDSPTVRWQYCAIPKCISKVCRSEAEVLFVLDASGSIGPKNFGKLKEFVKGLIKSFTLGADLIRVAILSFSHEVHVEIKLSDNMGEVLKALENMDYMRKTTHTDKALAEIRKLLLIARKKVPRIAIVITDGKSTNAMKTKVEAKLNHNLEPKITTFAIGIGGGRELSDELMLIASSPSPTYVHMVNDFEGLETIKNKMAQYACPEEECVCTGSGDPHYKTCDGKWIHFMGKCKYVLAKACADNGNAYFEVRGDNMVCNNRRKKKITPSCTKAVEVIVYNRLIRIESDGSFTVDGEEQESPFKYSLIDTGMGNERFFYVDKDAQERTRVTTDFGLLVTFKSMRVDIHIPGRYKRELCGICGNYDGNKENDMVTKENFDVSHLSRHQQYAEVGESWLVPDKYSKLQECRPVPKGTPGAIEVANKIIEERIKEYEKADKVNCSARVMKLAKSTNYCGLFVWKKGPFADCLAKNPKIMEHAEAEHRNCIFDICGMKDNLKKVKIGSQCEALELLAKKCKETGVDVLWRKAGNCPLKCPRNSVYKEKMSGCPATCADPDPKCGEPDQEGCECSPGYVREGGNCVHKDSCGCYAMDGKYFKLGETRVSTDCLYSRTCSKGATKNSRVLCETKLEACIENNACVVKNGVRGCFPQKVVTQGGDPVILKPQNLAMKVHEPAPAKKMTEKEKKRLKVKSSKKARREERARKRRERQQRKIKKRQERKRKRMERWRRRQKAKAGKRKSRLQQRYQQALRKRLQKKKKPVQKGGQQKQAPANMIQKTTKKGPQCKGKNGKLVELIPGEKCQKFRFDGRVFKCPGRKRFSLKRCKCVRARKVNCKRDEKSVLRQVEQLKRKANKKRRQEKRKNKSKDKRSKQKKQLAPQRLMEEPQRKRGPQCRGRNGKLVELIPGKKCKKFLFEGREYKCPGTRKFSIKRCKCLKARAVNCKRDEKGLLKQKRIKAKQKGRWQRRRKTSRNKRFRSKKRRY